MKTLQGVLHTHTFLLSQLSITGAAGEGGGNQGIKKKNVASLHGSPCWPFVNHIFPAFKGAADDNLKEAERFF